MNRYHINPQTGQANVCKAKKECRFGDDEDHFISAEEARKSYELKTAEIISEFDRTGAIRDYEKEKLAGISKQHKALIQRLKKENPASTESIEKLEELEEELRIQTDIVRNVGYDARIAHRNAVIAGVVQKAQTAAFDKPVFSSAPSISFNEPNAKNDFIVVRELSAWGGITIQEAEEKISLFDESKSLTRDQYIVKLFQQGERKPKRIAFVDLETSAFSPTIGEIIEIGISVTDSEGNILEEVDERFDLQRDDVRENLGTGPKHIHKIDREDIRGKRKFTDSDVQEKIAEILNDKDTVVVAHNAMFEKRFLNHYLKGFRSSRDEESAEAFRSNPGLPFQDTKNLSQIFLHESNNNRLESFANANGVEYKDAHSAFPDADMARRSFFAFRKNLIAAPLGQRPNLKDS